jgi:V-type H+-transporting ATPase subunit H
MQFVLFSCSGVDLCSLRISRKFASVSGEEKTMVFGWLAQQVCKDSDKDVLIGLTALQSLLRRNEYRESFWREGGLDTLKTVVKSDNSNIQVLYQAVNCLWLLTFNQTIRQSMTDPVLVANLCDVLKHSAKDKVIRMTLATLRNLMNIAENNEMMISCGVLRALTLLSNKAWGDEDVEGDLRALFNTLEKKVNDLSSFDMYKNELLSKKLDWSSPCHRSERFWRQNVLRFEDDDYRCVRYATPHAPSHFPLFGLL